MKNNKALVITTIILGLLVVAMGSYIIYDNLIQKDNDVQNNNNEGNHTINEEDKHDSNNESIILTGISCGNDCTEYNNIDMNTEYVLNYNNQKVNISVNVFNSEDYEKSKINISTNDNQIYSIVDFTTQVKIFKFKDIYVVEYIQSQTQCGNTVDILINNDGTLIELPTSEMSDTLWNEDDENIMPSIMRTEFIESSNSIIIYKEMCSMCPSDSYQLGFKYTYLLENGSLKFQNKENVYCK